VHKTKTNKTKTQHNALASIDINFIDGA